MAMDRFITSGRSAAKVWLRAITLGLALVALPIASTTAGAQENYLRVSAKEAGRTQHVSVGLNKSLIIDLPLEVGEVIVSQPGVAGAIMRSKTRAIVQGVAGGDTNIFFLDAAGRSVSVLEVTVTQDSGALGSMLAQVIPGSKIDVQSFGNRVVLSGSARSQDDVAKAISIAAQFTGSPDSVASVVNVAGAQQVMLKVTIAEVSRNTVKELGINLSALGNIGSLATGFINNTTGLTNGIRSAGQLGGVGIDVALRALERRGAVRTLAEPTLTALSGETADFLVGGEVPILSGVQDGERQFAYKDFGVKLKFTPTVKSNGLVSLVVETEVSEVSDTGFALGEGVNVPGFNTRRAKTSVEMVNGSTLSIAGLIQDSTRQSFNSLPGIGNIPILGALFRSREFNRQQTELVIMVTPYLAEAGFPEALPTDRFVPAGDAEAVFLGHLEALYGVGGKPAPTVAGGYRGSVGFILD